MRTRMGMLAWVLTAGMALLPATAWGQYHEVPQPDPIVPLPLGHDRYETGGFYIAPQFRMYKQSNPLRDQVIARRGLVDFDGSITAALNGQTVFPGGSPPVIIPGISRPGTFIGSNRVALRADDVGAGSYQPGFALAAGWRFQDGLTVEFEYMHLLEAKYAASASLVPPGLQPGQLLADTFLFAPVFNFPIDYAGPAQKLALGNPGAAYGIWNGASLMQIDFVQRFTNIDLTVRIPYFQDDCTRCWFSVGPRFAWIWERFKWRTVSYDFSGVAFPDDVAIYTNIVSNRMYGVAFGCGTEWYLKYGLGLGVDLKVATLIDVVKERARYERADRATSSKRSKTEYTFVPEVQATAYATWYPTEGIQIRFGYDFMSFFNTISSKEPVTFSFGTLDPKWDRTTRIFDGFQAGFGLIF